jgi:hypothetical protein
VRLILAANSAWDDFLRDADLNNDKTWIAGTSPAMTGE